MRPGSARVLACPHCQAWQRCQALDFSYRQQVEVWSDLRVVHAFWHTPAEVVACGACGSLFRKADAERVGRLPSSVDELDFRMKDGWRLLPRFGKARELALLERYLAVPTILPLDLAAVEAALRLSHAGHPEDEIDLRLQLWRLHNDTRRRHQGASWRRLEGDFHDNLGRLLSLLATGDEFLDLLAAEIYRELGQFPAALQRLARVQTLYGHEKVALMNWSLAARRELLIYARG
ncbi:hypothetical protein [Chitinimonas sp.]|uniref:hypothetical protein n=1 Tax=Chitinimonas sp. TaxID=1934313 RepID=UPI002F92E636